MILFKMHPKKWMKKNSLYGYCNKFRACGRFEVIGLLTFTRVSIEPTAINQKSEQ